MECLIDLICHWILTGSQDVGFSRSRMYSATITVLMGNWVDTEGLVTIAATQNERFKHR